MTRNTFKVWAYRIGDPMTHSDGALKVEYEWTTTDLSSTVIATQLLNVSASPGMYLVESEQVHGKNSLMRIFVKERGKHATVLGYEGCCENPVVLS